MPSRKAIIFLGDGMADEPLAQLNGQTPLQAVPTPAMDSIAAQGCCGSLLTLPEGFPTGSEVANMSILGCDLDSEYSGRGPLEAAGRNVQLAPDDNAFRLNLVTLNDGTIEDYSGGHLDQEDAEQLIVLLNDRFGSENVRFYPGVSYRNILVLSGPRYSCRVDTEKPDDHQGDPIADNLPTPQDSAAAETAEFLSRLIRKAPDVLADAPVNRRLCAESKRPANGVWPWSGGRAGGFHTLHGRYGINSAVISAVDVIVGLGRCLGMDVIDVPGATGYIDTDYEGKADAAIEALRTHDFVYLHVEAIDETSHEGDLKKKLSAIADFDRRVVQRVLDAVGPEVTTVVLPDHPVPVTLGKHTRTPIPVAVHFPEHPPDAVLSFDEVACPGGSLGAMRNGDLMELLFGARQ